MRIDYIDIDGDNEEHVTAHGVSVLEIHQVFANSPSVKRNRTSGSAAYFADGVTDGGRRVQVPFDFQNRTARPITAWEVGR